MNDQPSGLSPSHDSIAGDADMVHMIANGDDVLSNAPSFDISRTEPEQFLSYVAKPLILSSTTSFSSPSTLHSVDVTPSALAPIGGTSPKVGKRTSIDTVFNFTIPPSVVRSGSSNGVGPRSLRSGSETQSQADRGGISPPNGYNTVEKPKGVAEHSYMLLQNQVSEKKTDDYKPLFPDSVTYISIASILCGLIISIVLAVGHHSFLSYLHARNVEDFSQFRVKGISNGIATSFSICLGFAATSALTQIKWRVAATEKARIENIDNLFALPAPLALCGILAHPRRQYFPPVLATILIQALILVSVLAPNSLTTTRSLPQTRDIQIPTLDLGAPEYPMTDIDPFISIDKRAPLTWLNVSASWERKLQAIILNPPENNWGAPPGCEAACTFEWEYEGPGLDCRDITPDEYTMTPSKIDWFPGNPTAYQANTTLVGVRSVVSQSTEEMQEPYDLSIQYATVRPRGTNPFDSQIRNGSGVYCQFRNTTYRASFELVNNTRRVNTSVLSYGDPLSTGDCVSRSTDAQSQCDFWWPNSWAISYTFASAFQGNITMLSLIGIDQIRDLAVIETMFNVTFPVASDRSLSLFDGPFFFPQVANLSESLVSLFSNFTLGLIPSRGATTTAKANVWNGQSVWNYTPWILWVVYMPAFLLAIPVVIHGLRSIQMNETGMEDKFSTFLLTTRGADLDDVCKQSENIEALQRVRLVHRKRGVFTVESTSHVI